MKRKKKYIKKWTCLKKEKNWSIYSESSIKSRGKGETVAEERERGDGIDFEGGNL